MAQGSYIVILVLIAVLIPIVILTVRQRWTERYEHKLRSTYLEGFHAAARSAHQDRPAPRPRPTSPERTAGSNVRPSAALHDFLAELVPGDSTIGDRNAGRRREDTALALARSPLLPGHEAQADYLASVLRYDTEADLPPKVRQIGESLGREGGRWLMVLVAHRAQHLADPHWHERRSASLAQAVDLFGGQVTILTGSGGPVVRRLEHAWDGVCGWQA